jgi:uncharacterized protein YodC (DUF2158 family)
MIQPFQPGDAVALRSGGFPMTVTGVRAEVEALAIAAGVPAAPLVQCAWLDDRGVLYSQHFAPAALTHIERKTVMRDEALGQAVWVFADTGLPIADHVAMVVCP